MGCNRSIYNRLLHAFIARSFIADRSDRFATSISLREHANERNATQNIW